MKKEESKFKEQVLADLKKLPMCWFLKTQEVSRRGIPDILMCLNSQFVAIELKREGEKPDALQSVRLRTIQAAGGVAFWTVPSQWAAHYQMLSYLSCK